jgi:competence protein ComEC
LVDFILLKPIFPAKFRKIPILLSLILIWSFTIFIDYGSSVVRSCIMILRITVLFLQRKPDLLHAMAIAGFLILIFDTQQLFDVGFQLSFIAVFGIFWLNEPILKYLPKPKNKIQNFLFNVVSDEFCCANCYIAFGYFIFINIHFYQ